MESPNKSMRKVRFTLPVPEPDVRLKTITLPIVLPKSIKSLPLAPLPIPVDKKDE